jgi:peptidoglycan/LPS O-acetylase OafA/YrhL
MMSSPSPRLHHIDALRAFAMLLGIGLHAALAYSGTPWIAVDSSKHEFFQWFIEVVHGFRMQLFFFVSGFFTVMLWRKRGLSRLLEQRFQRVGVPFLIGFATIVPAMGWVTMWSIDHVRTPGVLAKAAKSKLVEAIRKGELTAVQALVGSGVDVNQPDDEFGIPPLSWASLCGEDAIARALLDGGANVHARDRSGYRALHSAAFMGRAKVVELLLARGADLDALGSNSDTAREAANADTGTTIAIATAIRLPFTDLLTIASRRTECIAILDRARDARGNSWLAPLRSRLKTWRNQYRDWLYSPRWNVKINLLGPPVHLVVSPQFAHLWFLWFLCWFVTIFALVVLMVRYLPIPRIPPWLSVARLRLLWLLPLTLVPQLFMASLGPDTSIGLIPQPHLLVYYGVFFFVGGAYFDANDEQGRLGSWWPLWLLVAVASFWQAKQTLGDTIVSGAGQVLYAWAMIYGCLGLFQQVLARKLRVVRYLADSAYWLYLMHLPIIVFLQAYLRDWNYPGWQKFLAICVGTTIALLIVYQLLVRHTYVGTILNGPRAKPSA